MSSNKSTIVVGGNPGFGPVFLADDGNKRMTLLAGEFAINQLASSPSGGFNVTEATDVMTFVGTTGIAGPWASTGAADIFVAVGRNDITFNVTERPDTWATSSGLDRLDVENLAQTNASGAPPHMTTNGQDRILVGVYYGAAVIAQPDIVTAMTDSTGLTWKEEVRVLAGETTDNDNVVIQIWWAYSHEQVTNTTLSPTLTSGGATEATWFTFAVKGLNGNFDAPWDTVNNELSWGANFGSFDGTTSVVKAARKYSDGPANIISGSSPDFSTGVTSGVTLSAGNLKLTSTGTGNPDNFGYLDPSLGKTSGRWYWEVSFDAINGTNYGAGFDFVGNSVDGYIILNGFGGMLIKPNGEVWANTLVGNIGAITAGDHLAIAASMDSGEFWVKNITQAGNWNNDPAADPARGINGFSMGIVGNSIITAQHFPVSGDTPPATAPLIPIGVPAGNSSAAMTFNFGGTTYAGTKPDGFLSFGSLSSQSDFPYSAITFVALFSEKVPTGFDTLDVLSGFTQLALSDQVGSQIHPATSLQAITRHESVSIADNVLFTGTTPIHNWLMLYATLIAAVQSPGTWESTEATDTMVLIGHPGASGIVGSLGSFENPDVMTAFGFPQDEGIMAAHETPDIFGASGHQPLTGTFNTTEHADIFAAVGLGRGENGTWISTEGVDIFAATGNTPISGSLIAFESPDRFTATGAGVTNTRKRRHVLIA